MRVYNVVLISSEFFKLIAKPSPPPLSQFNADYTQSNEQKT